MRSLPHFHAVDSNVGIGQGTGNCRKDGRSCCTGNFWKKKEEERDAFEGMQFDVNLICFVQEQQQHQDDSLARNVVLEFGEVQLTMLREDLEEGGECFINASQRHHGVTLPRLSERLKGWEDPDSQDNDVASLHSSRKMSLPKSLAATLGEMLCPCLCSGPRTTASCKMGFEVDCKRNQGMKRGCSDRHCSFVLQKTRFGFSFLS
jgi:hypothetical protein